MPQLRARSFRARHKTQLHANCMPRLRPAASRNCGHQLHAATAGHCFHVVIITCVGLRKRRARGRISLASSPGPKNTLMGIPFAHHLMQLWPNDCPSPISATAAMTSLWDSQRWHPIETSTRFVMNEKGKCIRNPILVLPQKLLHPSHEHFRPAVPILLEHA